MQSSTSRSSDVARNGALRCMALALANANGFAVQQNSRLTPHCAYARYGGESRAGPTRSFQYATSNGPPRAGFASRMRPVPPAAGLKVSQVIDCSAGDVRGVHPCWTRL